MATLELLSSKCNNGHSFRSHGNNNEREIEVQLNSPPKSIRFYTFSITAVLLVALIIGLLFLSKKLTYLETAYITYTADDSITINENNKFLEERFQMPYDIFKSFSIQIGNNQRDSNSTWRAYLLTDTGSIIAQKLFGFYDAVDGEFYTIDFGKAFELDRGCYYRIRIEAVSVEEGNKISFYTGSTTSTQGQGSSLYLDGNDVPGHLRLIINGGNRDFFWFAIYATIILFLGFVCFRWIKLKKSGIAWHEDALLCSLLVGLVVLLLYLPFSSMNLSGAFTDEYDNIRGGMIIASGKVLYRDYVVQHTPIGYYLCAIFAILGANSVVQMRILFYMSMAVCWGLMYARYHNIFGKKAMFAVPVAIILGTRLLLGDSASMILADSIQEISLVFLMLEFISYTKNTKLDWSRCIVLSIAVWTAIGSAFISLYSIFFCFCGFVTVEVLVWKHRKYARVKDIAQRYFLLVISMLIPLVAGITYFKVNNALYQSFSQIYLFNREVYVKYQSMGRNVFEPLLSGLSSMLDNYTSSIIAIAGSGEVTAYNLLVIILITGYVAYIVSEVLKGKKKLSQVVIVTLMIAAGATRGVENFHSLPFWGMIITWLIVFPLAQGNVLTCSCRQLLLWTAIACTLIGIYVSALTTIMATEQKTISYEDAVIVDYTTDGEGIFIDAYSNDSIYLLAKNRFPINRAVYCLPWYMDWYESWDIEDLLHHMPNIVVWNPNQECWGRSNYAGRISDLVQLYYVQSNESPIIWCRS